jgi:beta-lactamase class A
VRNRNTSILIRIVSIIFLSATAIITIIALIGYSRQRNFYPAGMTIAGVPAGGLDPQSASQRVLQVYTTPVEAQYGEALIQISPSSVGFEINIDSMVAAADLVRTGDSFWGGFWDYLWNRESTPTAIPLSSSLAEDRLRTFLVTEIASRYDIPPEPAQPLPGTARFALTPKPHNFFDISTQLSCATNT